MITLKKITLSILTCVLAFISSGNVNAALVSNYQVINQVEFAIDKETLIENIQHKEIQAKFIELGIDKSEVENRISQLTHSEITELNSKINDLPAGSGAESLLVTLFVVFVITDILGATDIFPFIRPIT